MAFRSGNWKLIDKAGAQARFNGDVELYDLAADPGETKNLAKERPEITRKLEAGLSAARK